jgi:hypothetical protein
MNYSLHVNSVFGGHHLTVSGGRSAVLTWPTIEAATAALVAKGFLNDTNARTSTKAPKSAYVIEAPISVPTVAAS